MVALCRKVLEHLVSELFWRRTLGFVVWPYFLFSVS